MKKAIFGILAVAVLAGGAIFVVAQKAGHRGHGGFGGRNGNHVIGMVLRGLDLTDEQKAKVKGIMEASRTNVEPLMKQMHDGRAKFAGLGTDGTFDQNKVEAVANEQASVMAKLIVEKEKAKAQVFALLTDEQKAKAAEMRQKFEERMRGHNGFVGKRGGSEF